eukprot:COSAG04_NODE_2453_length_4093_cov_4.621933_3_plen_266_part_00
MAEGSQQPILQEWTDSSTGVFAKQERGDAEHPRRRKLCAAAAAAAAAVVVLLVCLPPAGEGSAGDGTGHVPTQGELPWTAPVVLEQGTLKGRVRTTSLRKSPAAGLVQVAEYKGIPFAQPPLPPGGRFAPPRPPLPWAGTLDASRFKDNCVSGRRGRDDSIQSEDCLYLNVWSPVVVRPHRPMAVIFWMYGGGFQNGGANSKVFNGTWIAAAKDVVVVTVNFRGNMFGFLAAEELRALDPDGGSGNMGILDQRLALRWCQTNIGA